VQSSTSCEAKTGQHERRRGIDSSIVPTRLRIGSNSNPLRFCFSHSLPFAHRRRQMDAIRRKHFTVSLARRPPGAILNQRIRESQNRPIQAVDMTVQQVVDALWRPHLSLKTVRNLVALLQSIFCIGIRCFSDPRLPARNNFARVGRRSLLAMDQGCAYLGLLSIPKISPVVVSR
jgi:hypothetical protein